MEGSEKRRFWEVDAVRGAAVVMMICYHAAYDMDYLGIIPLSLESWGWWIFGRSIPVLFLSVLGVSAALKYSRMKSKGAKDSELFLSFAKRGFLIFMLGMLITGITFFLFPERYVRFGILHLIGLSLVMILPFLKLNYSNLFFGALFVISGALLWNMEFSFPYFIWLGLEPADHQSFDLFPLLPWFGLVLWGLFIGKYFYPLGKRRIQLNYMPKGKLKKGIELIGTHSLLIYIVHPPVLIGVMYLILKIN